MKAKLTIKEATLTINGKVVARILDAEYETEDRPAERIETRLGQLADEVYREAKRGQRPRVRGRR